jgi:hypothetical protein
VRALDHCRGIRRQQLSAVSLHGLAISGNEASASVVVLVEGTEERSPIEFVRTGGTWLGGEGAATAAWTMRRPSPLPPGTLPYPRLPEPVSTEAGGLRFTLTAARRPLDGRDDLQLALTARNVSSEKLVVSRNATTLKVEGNGAKFQGLPAKPAEPGQ